MTRIIYSQIKVDFTPATTSFPSIANMTADIENLYKQAADILAVEYSVTVPDTSMLYALIDAKLSAYYMDLRKNRSVQANFTRKQEPLIWNEREETLIKGKTQKNDEWTIDAANYNQM